MDKKKKIIILNFIIKKILFLFIIIFLIMQKNLKLNAIHPSDRTSFVSMGGIDYIIGTLFILIGLLIIVTFYKKVKRNTELFKKKQLEEYNKNKGTKITDYKKTKLFLPFWERVKYSAPVTFCVLFIIVGLSWIIWTANGVPLTTL